MRLLLLAVLASLTLPLTSASASVTSAGQVTHDDQWSRYTLPMTCDEAPACTVELTISYQFVGGYPKFEPLGPRTVADTKTVTVPEGTSDVVVETGKVIEGLARKGGAFRVHLEGGDYRGQSFGNYPKVGSCGKGSPVLLRWKGPGKLTFRAEKDESFDRVSGPVTRDTFMVGTRYEVTGGSVSYAYKGVSYTFARGAKFGMTCTGNTSVARAASILSPYLHAGAVTVTASKRKMRQPAAWIMTSEGNLGTRAKETTRFTVSRKRSVSTLSMKKGRAGTITPWNTAQRSPCRAGQKLSVDRRGRIR